ncbi:hypothetical protein SRHO_G00013090 [Serrasalmus rhombeus]
MHFGQRLDERQLEELRVLWLCFCVKSLLKTTVNSCRTARYPLHCSPPPCGCKSGQRMASTSALLKRFHGAEENGGQGTLVLRPSWANCWPSPVSTLHHQSLAFRGGETGLGHAPQDRGVVVLMPSPPPSSPESSQTPLRQLLRPLGIGPGPEGPQAAATAASPTASHNLRLNHPPLHTSIDAPLSFHYSL